MTPQEFDAWITREAWQVVRRARLTSEHNLRAARLPPADVERVLDMLERTDVENYQLAVATLREQLPKMLRAPRVETVH